jgi:hypothetical protein
VSTKLTGVDLKAVFATKFFVSVPDPIFDQFVERRLSRTAILVHMVHLKAGAIDGAYCSEIPIRTVAARCGVSTSQVSRAYQELRAAGLIERTDPGRDADRPMQQAVALTQCCLPAGLVRRLGTYPNRPSKACSAPRPSERAASPQVSEACPTPAPTLASTVPDPLEGLTGRDRRAALDRLLQTLSSAERARFHEATCHSAPAIEFDADSQAPEQTRQALAQLLARNAQAKPAEPPAPRCTPSPSPTQAPRRISPGQLAELRRGLQRAAGSLEVDELMRQVVWSVLHGALAKRSVVHGLRTGVKLVRERVWTRPHGMPPNWVLKLTEAQLLNGPARSEPSRAGRAEQRNVQASVAAVHADAHDGSRAVVRTPEAQPTEAAQPISQSRAGRASAPLSAQRPLGQVILEQPLRETLAEGRALESMCSNSRAKAPAPIAEQLTRWSPKP